MIIVVGMDLVELCLKPAGLKIVSQVWEDDELFICFFSQVLGITSTDL